MEEKKNTGGPAFPVSYPSEEPNGDPTIVTHMGATLRDYFAAKAMQGILADSEINPHALGLNIAEFQQLLAEKSYGYADAMLKAREQ